MYCESLPQEFEILTFSEVGATWMAYPMQGISGWRTFHGLVMACVWTVSLGGDPLEGDVSTNILKKK